LTISISYLNIEDMNINYSKHATYRCSSRGIPHHIVKFILENGDHLKSYKDEIYFVSKKTFQEVFVLDKDYALKYEKLLKGTALVCNGNDVITAMKIKRRLKCK